MEYSYSEQRTLYKSRFVTLNAPLKTFEVSNGLGEVSSK